MNVESDMSVESNKLTPVALTTIVQHNFEITRSKKIQREKFFAFRHQADVLSGQVRSLIKYAILQNEF